MGTGNTADAPRLSAASASGATTRAASVRPRVPAGRLEASIDAAQTRARAHGLVVVASVLEDSRRAARRRDRSELAQFMRRRVVVR